MELSDSVTSIAEGHPRLALSDVEFPYGEIAVYVLFGEGDGVLAVSLTASACSWPVRTECLLHTKNSLITVETRSIIIVAK